MNQQKPNFKIPIVIILSIIALILPLHLLYSSKIDGDNFVILTISIIFFSIVICIFPKVSEFSIAGNIIKMKEIDEDIKEKIDLLNDLIIESYRAITKQISVQPGGIRSNTETKEVRLDRFWDLIESFHSEDLRDNLHDELISTVKDIKAGQFFVIKNFVDIPNDYRNCDSNELLKASYKFLPEKEKRYPSWTDEDRENNKMRMIEAIEEYRKLENFLSSLDL